MRMPRCGSSSCLESRDTMEVAVAKHSFSDPIRLSKTPRLVVMSGSADLSTKAQGGHLSSVFEDNFT